MADAQPIRDGLDDRAVAAWLGEHPRFLAEQPDLYRRLAPPVRVHGEALADHMAAMLQAERRHADSVLAAGRAAAGLTARVQEAVLALLAAADPVDCVTAEFPAILAIDAACLCSEAASPAGARPLPAGMVARLLGRGSVTFRDAPEDSAVLHAEAAPLARHDALVRVPGVAPMLLALATRERAALDRLQGSAPLAFLGRAVATAIVR